jgi:hypothetical protein
LLFLSALLFCYRFVTTLYSVHFYKERLLADEATITSNNNATVANPLVLSTAAPLDAAAPSNEEEDTNPRTAITMNTISTSTAGSQPQEEEGGEATANREIVDFQHQPGVVIATTIHGPKEWPQLLQSQCLLQAAYNNRTHYNVVVFTTLPIDEQSIQQLQAVIEPATLTVKVDEKNLTQMLDELTDAQRETLLKSCHVNSTDNIYWNASCSHQGYGFNVTLSYTWQCEFRSKHLWVQPELARYRYMLWYDSDAMATVRWDSDPVAETIRRNAVMLFDHFPQGAAKAGGADFQGRYQRGFNRTDRLCGINLNGEKGHLFAKFGNNCTAPHWSLVHGFFHITDLDWYRGEVPQRWMRELIGDTKFSRTYDDQIAVTVPAAVLAPNRSLDMRSIGLNLQVLHNGVLDGQEYWRENGKSGFFRKFWEQIGRHRFPEAMEMNCPLSSPGR